MTSLTDTLTVSEKRFSDGGQFRTEIPSTETPKAFRLVLEEADKLGCPVHRISQGSGIQMLSDEELREFSRIGAERAIEVCLFVTPRAAYDTGGLWTAPAGKFIQWQARGSEQLQYGLDDIHRACEHGIRSVLIADLGLIELVRQQRNAGQLPRELIIKSSAVMAPANGATCRIIEQCGANTINVATDLSVTQLSTIRQQISAPIDMYVEAPDGLGGYVRHHEAPAMIRYASPVYIKLGLRNSPDIYPYGAHMEGTALALGRERVRRTKLVLDLIRRQYPEAQMSPTSKRVADLGVPVQPAT